ncbi:MAG: hypothetical protein J0I06_26135 [Planctomycetes bacterium]|nr:hypothetical protein [Planctomycetota bacterium]
MARPVPPALRALLEHLVDYAGTFPPAALPCAVAAANFAEYRQGERAWMLRRLVVGAADLDRVPAAFDGALTVLSESDQPRAAAIESKCVVAAARPVYCEVPIAELDAVKRAGCFAKMRTGGVKPEAVPSVADVAAFVRACADRRLAFKATAGLHHPVRAEQALTYEPNAPRAVTHGFLNVFLAACFAWDGDRDIEPILAETDPTAFRFDGRAHWRDRSLDVDDVRAARANFCHAFGSCSFEEPVRDLEALGLL